MILQWKQGRKGSPERHSLMTLPSTGHVDESPVCWLGPNSRTPSGHPLIWEQDCMWKPSPVMGPGRNWGQLVSVSPTRWQCLKSKPHLRVPRAQLRERLKVEPSHVELERRTGFGLLCWKWLREWTPPREGGAGGGKEVKRGHFVRIHATYSVWMFYMTVYLFLLPGLQYLFLTLPNLQYFFFFLKLIFKIVCWFLTIPSSNIKYALVLHWRVGLSGWITHPIFFYFILTKWGGRS